MDWCYVVILPWLKEIYFPLKITTEVENNFRGWNTPSDFALPEND